MGTETLAQGAKTVVGTPYYISPEMCSGKTYNEKSDMWALGCILYEMCTYAPVRGPYSSEIKLLIRELLQHDPEARPRAAEALRVRLQLPALRYSPVIHCLADASTTGIGCACHLAFVQ
ncbi:hypothetical protein TELCIR_17087 [Teladorsagia circumcincta]|uniref:Protein kinase domain-containing protein n=1 Tax=Teladorsagia circumcincta TaxID=45464 RepID=A0A2G9TTQ6_TELCI|nr:hypothetical protein TELCIR_17087 [Teladorsagia circumcincta]